MGAQSLSINIGIGIFVIILWMFVISPELKTTNELIELTSESTGYIQLADNIGDPLSEPIKMKFIWTRDIVEEKGNEIMIHTVYDYVDLNSNESFWAIELDELVDRKTKKYSEKPGYFSFPTYLEKKNYDVYDVGGSVMPYKFEGIDEFDGLTVYKFSGSVTFDISSEYPDFGAQIFEDYSAVNFIDPITGTEISFSEKFTDYAIIDGEKIPILDAWDESTSFSETVLTKKAQDLIILFSIYDTIIPSIIILFVFAITIAVEIILKLRKNLIVQQQFKIKNERLATIGELAARIAHDIRNPLTIIQNSTSTLRFLKDDSIKFEKNLERTERAIHRITHQVEGIMDFIRETDLKLESISVRKLLNSVVTEMKIPFEIIIKLPDIDIKIQCDVLKIESLFNNLIINSIQSMNNTGTIIIKISESNGMITIDVVDEGEAISDDVMKNIFEPLFTTKQTGTGLGLVSCKNIVNQHHGTICVKNNPVTFTIVLPLKQN